MILCSAVIITNSYQIAADKGVAAWSEITIEYQRAFPDNADPIWLLQNEMYEELYQWEQERDAKKQNCFQSELARDFKKPGSHEKEDLAESDDLPF